MPRRSPHMKKPMKRAGSVVQTEIISRSRGPAERAGTDDDRRIVDTETQHDDQHANVLHVRDDEDTVQVSQCRCERRIRRKEAVRTPEECIVLPMQRRQTDTATQAGDSVKEEEEDQVMMVKDVARAYFEAPVTRIIAVEFPEEDGGGKDSEFVGLCKNPSMARGTQPPIFGRRCASSCRITISLLANSVPAPVTIGKRICELIVHGGDFISCGRLDAVSWFKSCLEVRFEVKKSMIGHGPDDANEGRVLNRIIRANSGGWEY